MTPIPASHRVLLRADVTTLATPGGDEPSQMSELWFRPQDDTVRLSLNAARQKVRICDAGTWWSYAEK
jgi:hypothetical protein